MEPIAGPPEPVSFAGGVLEKYYHVCGFFRDPEEEYRVLLPFIKEGFEKGEKAFHVVDPDKREEHRKRLEAAGIELDPAESSGQFQFCDWEQAYFPDGRFDQDRMLTMWQEVLGGAERAGYRRTRLVAHMEWSLEDRDGVTDLLEYEARFNLIPRKKDPVICAYDLARYSGNVIVDVMRTHPMIVIGGVLQQNPFFVPPERFLLELQERDPS